MAISWNYRFTKDPEIQFVSIYAGESKTYVPTTAEPGMLAEAWRVSDVVATQIGISWWTGESQVAQAVDQERSGNPTYTKTELHADLVKESFHLQDLS